MTLILPPIDRPVELDEAKRHLRIDFQDDDDLIAGYLDAAIAMLDGPYGLLQMALKPQTWEMSSDRFPGYAEGFEPTHQIIEMPLRPLIEVESIKYDDSDGTEQTIDPADYIVDAARQPGRITLPSGGQWPAARLQANSVRIRFRAGHADVDTPSGYSDGTASTVPGAIKAAILLMVGDMFEFRETAAQGRNTVLPIWTTVEKLILPYKPLIIA